MSIFRNYMILIILCLQSIPCKPHESLSLTPLEQRMQALGLVDIQQLDSCIRVDLMYRKAQNFTGKVLYKDLTKAYLHPHAAQAFLRAQQLLKQKFPAYSLILYDAARPMSVQQIMWNAVKGTPQYKYVSNPQRGGGLHNYGLAVDVSIVDENGTPLPMGTPVDHLGKEAHITQEEALVQTGKISPEALKNRRLLRTVMKQAGFRALPTEWWHFNYCSREVAKQKYTLIP